MKEKSKDIVHVLPGVHEIRPLVTPALLLPFIVSCKSEGGCSCSTEIAGALSQAPQQFTHPAITNTIGWGRTWEIYRVLYNLVIKVNSLNKLREWPGFLQS